MNPFAELKKRFAPQSRWGAIGLAPRRESGRLTWSEPEERRQPQDGALVNAEALMDEPEVTPLRRGPVKAVPSSTELRRPATTMLG